MKRIDPVRFLFRYRKRQLCLSFAVAELKSTLVSHSGTGLARLNWITGR